MNSTNQMPNCLNTPVEILKNHIVADTQDAQQKSRTEKIMHSTSSSGAYESLYDKALKTKSNRNQANLISTTESKLIDAMINDYRVNNNPIRTLFTQQTKSRKCNLSVTSINNKSLSRSRTYSKVEASLMITDLIQRSNDWVKDKNDKLKTAKDAKSMTKDEECTFTPVSYTKNYSTLQHSKSPVSANLKMKGSKGKCSYSQIGYLKSKAVNTAKCALGSPKASILSRGDMYEVKYKHNLE